MACLDIREGLFRTDVNWTEAPAGTTQDGLTTVSLDANRILIQKNGRRRFLQNYVANTNGNYIIFGNHIWILTKGASGDPQVSVGPHTRTVSVIEDTGNSLEARVVLRVGVDGTNVDLPVVNPSQNNGDVFLVWAPNGTGRLAQTVGLSICNSFNGDVLCALGSNFNATGETRGGFVNEDDNDPNSDLVLRLSYSSGDRRRKRECPPPIGNCDVRPNSQNFGEVIVGAADAGRGKKQETFTIQNDGQNCFIINNIANAGAFSIVDPQQLNFPINLEPQDDFIVTVEFAPNASGNYSEDLAIQPPPPSGDTVLECRGSAREARPSISIPVNSINFVSTAIGSSINNSLTITNNGELNTNVEVDASPRGSVFSWNAINEGALAPGASVNIPITFSPNAEGAANAVLSVNSGALRNPANISLTGSGCIPNPVINTPAITPINLGNVQQGFRAVKIFTINNTGDGPLTLRARITNDADGLFGLQTTSGSITSPQNSINLTINPQNPCGNGSSGDGNESFAIAFFAEVMPGQTPTADLVIDNHNDDNAVESFTYSLSADVIAGVAVDAALVLDHSGSMGENSGNRNKSQTSIDAGKLFVNLSRPNTGDRLTLVKFDETPEVFKGITAMQVDGANNIDTIAEFADAINSNELAPQGDTSIAGGVLTAVNEINNNSRATPPEELNQAIIVLTDGKDNTPFVNPTDNITYTLLGEEGTQPLNVPAPLQLFAVGIGNGNNIDEGRLSELAQATGGQYLSVSEFSGQNLFGLEKYFTQIYMNLVDLSIISDPVYTIAPRETHTTEFDILRGDKSFMVVIYDYQNFRLPFILTAPNGEIVDIASLPQGYQIRPGITNTARFLEVNLPINEPDRYAGRWVVTIENDATPCMHTLDEGSVSSSEIFENYGSGFVPNNCKAGKGPVTYGIAIGAGSNFRMMPYVTPGIVSVGEEIILNAAITEFNLPVQNCVVTVEAKDPNGNTTHHTLEDDGLHFDNEENDGFYGYEFTRTFVQGTYTFIFRATGQSRDGEPVTREAVRSKFVQGTEPLVPEGGKPNDIPVSDDKCCNELFKLVRIGFILLLILLIIIIVVLLRN